MKFKVCINEQCFSSTSRDMKRNQLENFLTLSRDKISQLGMCKCPLNVLCNCIRTDSTELTWAPFHPSWWLWSSSRAESTWGRFYESVSADIYGQKTYSGININEKYCWVAKVRRKYMRNKRSRGHSPSPAIFFFFKLHCYQIWKCLPWYSDKISSAVFWWNYVHNLVRKKCP
jgi:hypothetical protein